MAAHILDLGQQASKVDVAAVLERLLQGVQMQDKAIGLDHLHRSPTFIEAIAVVKLHCPQVGQKQDVGSYAAHLVGIGPLGIFDGCPL